VSAVSVKDLKTRMPSSKDEIAVWGKELSGGSDRSVALLATNFLDQSLKVSLLCRLLQYGMDEARLRAELFDEYGMLYLFDQKIKMAHAFGLFGNVTRSNLDTIKKVRNLYAHSTYAISFSTPIIRDWCKGLVRVPAHFRMDVRHRFRTARDKFVITALETGRTIAFTGGVQVTSLDPKPEPDPLFPPLP
jgi:hypothetical protein